MNNADFTHSFDLIDATGGVNRYTARAGLSVKRLDWASDYSGGTVAVTVYGLNWVFHFGGGLRSFRVDGQNVARSVRLASHAIAERAAREAIALLVPADYEAQHAARWSEAA